MRSARPRPTAPCARSSVDRALGCGPKGREFESRRARQNHKARAKPHGLLTEERPGRRDPTNFLNGLVERDRALDEKQHELSSLRRRRPGSGCRPSSRSPSVVHRTGRSLSLSGSITSSRSMASFSRRYSSSSMSPQPTSVAAGLAPVTQPARGAGLGEGNPSVLAADRRRVSSDRRARGDRSTTTGQIEPQQATNPRPDGLQSIGRQGTLARHGAIGGDSPGHRAMDDRDGSG